MPTGVSVIKLGPMQRMAAEHLSRSRHETAAVTLLGEARVDALVALRESLNVGRTQGVRFSLTTVLVKIVAQALRTHPDLNATLVEGVVHRSNAVHMGVALALEDGNLIVPVLKNADALGLVDLARSLADLEARGKAGKLALADVRGATFTLTNAGVIGSARWSTPIIALPQCAILGVGALRRAPVVRDEAVVPAWVIPTSLTFDHRAVNGVPAQRFIGTLHALLEDPAGVDFGI